MIVNCDLCGHGKDEKLEMYPWPLFLPKMTRHGIIIYKHSACNECVLNIAILLDKETPPGRYFDDDGEPIEKDS